MLDNCEHNEFHASVDVQRLVNATDGPVVGYRADIKVKCGAYKTEFEWMGVNPGLNAGYPTSDLSYTELTAPLRPVGSDPDFGLDLPGYSVEIFTHD
jgi:hypothetical protein